MLFFRKMGFMLIAENFSMLRPHRIDCCKSLIFYVPVLCAPYQEGFVNNPHVEWSGEYLFACLSGCAPAVVIVIHVRHVCLRTYSPLIEDEVGEPDRIRNKRFSGMFSQERAILLPKNYCKHDAAAW